MNILYFAPTATKKNPSLCPFITQRIFKLQRQGHAVVTIQGGNLIISNPFNTKRKGFLKILAIIYKVFKNTFAFNKNRLKVFTNELGSLCYYDRVSFVSYRSFFQWYKKNKFDIIHAHFLWYSESLPELKNKLGIHYVVTIHGSDIHEITSYDSDQIEKSLEILNNADKCIFISKYLLKYAMSLGYDGINATIINNGFNPDIFYLKKHKKSKNDYLIGFVGHLIFIKRADLLPRVLKLIKKKLPNTKLIILGCNNGDLFPYIKFMTCKLNLQNDISFVPTVNPEKVGEYMRKLDVLLLPSRNEGFGVVAIEAQACGVGVVGSANGGIPEAVGENGICVPESENFLNDYANAVIEWLSKEHDPKKIAKRVKDYTWENCIKKEVEIYNSIINNI